MIDWVNRLSMPFIVLIIAVAVFSSFGNALFNRFVWDDGYLIVSNPYIKSAQFIVHLFNGDLVRSTTSLHFESGYYRPLSMLSFLVDYQIWQLDAFGYHLTNVLLFI